MFQERLGGLATAADPIRRLWVGVLLLFWCVFLLRGTATAQDDKKAKALLPRVITVLQEPGAFSALHLSADGKYLYLLGRYRVAIYQRDELGYEIVSDSKRPLVNLEQEGLILLNGNKMLLGKSSSALVSVDFSAPLQPVVMSTQQFDESKSLYNFHCSADGTTLASHFVGRPPVRVVDIRSQKMSELQDLWPSKIEAVWLSQHAGHLMVLQEGVLTLFDTASLEPLQMVQNPRFGYGSRFVMQGRGVLSRDSRSPKRSQLFTCQSGKQQTVAHATRSDDVIVTHDGRWMIEFNETTVFYHDIDAKTLQPEKLVLPLTFDLEKSCEAKDAPVIAAGGSSSPVVILEYPVSQRDEAANDAADSRG